MVLLFGAQYHHSGPIFKNKQKAMICRNYNKANDRCYGNLRFRVVNAEIRCDLEHLAAFRAHSDHCEYAFTNQQLRALGKPEFGMYRGKALGCAILNPPPAARSNQTRERSPVRDDYELSGKYALMRAIGLREVRRDDRKPNKLGEKEIQLLEGFGTVKECLDRMWSCLEDLLSVGLSDRPTDSAWRESALEVSR